MFIKKKAGRELWIHFCLSVPVSQTLAKWGFIFWAYTPLIKYFKLLEVFFVFVVFFFAGKILDSQNLV